MADLPHLKFPRADVQNKLSTQVGRGEALIARTIMDSDQLNQLHDDRTAWVRYTTELLRQVFDSEEYAKEFEFAYEGNLNPRPIKVFGDRVMRAHISTKCHLSVLRSICERLDLLTEVIQPAANVAEANLKTLDNKKVFIVHGHDGAVISEVARMLTKLGLQPIILHEQTNEGRTIVEKFEVHSDVGFAVVLLTPDDVGGTNANELNKRARQNVVLELGYFIGKLGRSRVCPLYKSGVELPSDMSGVVYVSLDGHGAWQMKLTKELKSAGYKVSLDDL